MSLYDSLLKTWCDGLIAHQLKHDDPCFDGGLLCPACKTIHGRCIDAVYPLLHMADKTGDRKYLNAALKLFDWNTNMVCDDGSMYNDATVSWNGITVFASIAICEALSHYGHLLSTEQKARWDDRLKNMGHWLYTVLDEHFDSNINYIATNAAALTLIGLYFDNAAYVEQAKKLAWFVLDHFSENGLLIGEGHPYSIVTERGCRPVDIGYNVEESIPSLVKYAYFSKDGKALARLKDVLKKQLAFMLPDGAWDNSFGSRNNKWTYWGSRTSDGCASAYALLGTEEPAFALAAYRNVALLASCTHNGLLYGGPHYYAHHEPPCIHHTFCHANALAFALDNGGRTECPQHVYLPCEQADPVVYFPEIDTYKIAVGDYRATVTGYDFRIANGHATGGTLSLVWHPKTGPITLSSVLDYRIVEPLNLQLSRQKTTHRSLVPRLEFMAGSKRFTNCYDTAAHISVTEQADGVDVSVQAKLVSIEQQEAPDAPCSIIYQIRKDGVTVKGTTKNRKAVYIFPQICGSIKGNYEELPASIFCLTGGFQATEYRFHPDENGDFSFSFRA